MSERIWNILVEGFVKIMLASIKVTIPLTVLGFSFAMIIAMFMAMVQYAKVPVLRQLSRLYISMRALTVRRRCARRWRQFLKDRWKQAIVSE